MPRKEPGREQLRSLRIALAQMNPTVGDIEGNTSKIIHYMGKAKTAGADIVAFPELAITGYPPEDLLLKTRFIEDNLRALKKIQRHVDTVTAIVGFVDRREDIYNAAAVLHNKKIIDVYHKMYLPNYGVFDEHRYFQVGVRCPIYQLGDTWFGVNICEDMWYPEGPARMQALAGAEVIININASPYRIDNGKFRQKMLSTRAADNTVIIAYLNMVGGQDELVFDGQSLIVDQNGSIIARGAQFKEDIIIADLELEGILMKRLHTPLRRQEVIKLEKGAVDKILIPAAKIPRKKLKNRTKTHLQPPAALEPMEEIYRALVLGTADYVGKNGFEGVVIGLSGGIDSALVASIAVDALGRKNVTGLFMPSPYTTKESREDAFELARALGITVKEIPITGVFESYLATLKAHFKGLPADVTEENLQARIRGNLLMAFSNKYRWLVLTTGNKSEMSVGYATLYGDMAGGFAVIKDVPKTMVYELCAWKNRSAPKTVIPPNLFTKEPSAELKPGQKDRDTLPPYAVLDPLLKAYIEDDRSLDVTESSGCDAKCMRKIIAMIDKSEYKRRQAPPGIKISQRALGRDRRFPITNKYRGF